MAATAALGFKLHTGWAAVVAIRRVPSKLEVPLRRRIELLPPGDSIPLFVYHQAAELSLSQAVELVRRARVAAEETARVALRDVLDQLRSLSITVKAAGVACGSKPVPPDLSAVLRSHPLIHSAEAALFRQAIVSACEDCGLAVISVREREVWPKAAGACGLKEAALRGQVDNLRKSVGAPWGADQKAATAFAVLALRSDLAEKS
jgi:hypothetical protein